MPSFNPDVFGYLAGILTTVAFVPQVWKTWRTRSAEDLSMTMLVTFTTGVACWFAYGVALGSTPMIVSNAVTLAQSAFLIGMKGRADRA
jgi:MtN3 and saliva related transmembrane protein